MFKAIKQKCVSDIIIDQIKEMVYEGKLKAGDRLPSEIELGEKIGVSRASLRESLKALKVMGLIESKTGGGNFITNDFDNAVSDSLSLMVALNNTNSKEIFEFRQAIELGAISKAAENCTDEDLKELKECLENLEKSQDEESIAKYDREFHNKIVDMSGNIFLKVSMNAIGEILSIFLFHSAGKSKKEEILKIHTEIYEALKNRQPKEAESKMRKHLKQVEKKNF